MRLILFFAPPGVQTWAVSGGPEVTRHVLVQAWEVAHQDTGLVSATSWVARDYEHYTFPYSQRTAGFVPQEHALYRCVRALKELAALWGTRTQVDSRDTLPHPANA